MSIHSPAHPLYGIDDLDWSQWHTAYGDATDTQWNLKRLVNLKTKKSKSDALLKIFQSVYYQGENYSAIPITLHYLIRILKSGCRNNRLELEIFCLITKLGRLGYFHAHWIVGIPSDIDNLVSAWFDRDEINTFYQAYERMEELREYCLGKIKSHKSSAIRCQCAYLLMYLQKDRQSIITFLQNHYPHEKNLNVRLSIIWAIAFLAAHLPADSQRQVRSWLNLHKPRTYRSLAGHMFTLAEAYVTENIPEVQSRVIQMIKDNLEYPLLLNQYRFGPDDLVGIALQLIKTKSNPSNNELHNFFKEILKAHCDFLGENDVLDKYALRINVVFEALINYTFNQTFGLHQYWSDHSWQEQQDLRSQLNPSQIETLTWLCLYPVWLNHNTSFLMRKVRLPESYEEIALFLGWLPQFDHGKQKDQSFRLPSEAEWEYLARGTKQQELTWNGHVIPDKTWMKEIKQYQNVFCLGEFGLRAEICSDVWKPTHTAMDHKPVVGEGPRVCRGGAADLAPWQNCGEWHLLCTAFRYSAEGMLLMTGRAVMGIRIT